MVHLILCMSDFKNSKTAADLVREHRMGFDRFPGLVGILRG
jgi:hypothetical protein